MFSAAEGRFRGEIPPFLFGTKAALAKIARRRKDSSPSFLLLRHLRQKENAEQQTPL